MPNNANASGSHRPARRPTATGSGGMSGSGENESRPVPSPAPTGRGATPRPVPMESPDSKTQRRAKKLLMDDRQLSLLQNNLRVIGLYVNSRHLEMLSPAPTGALYHSTVREPAGSVPGSSGIAVYEISKLVFNEDENSYEKLVSVYSALNSFGGLVAMILKSDGKVVKLHLCTNTSGDGKTAGGLLAGNLHGQFPGCEIRCLADNERASFLGSLGPAKPGGAGSVVRSLSMIPSRREDERQHDKLFSAQGYEKFIDAMQGRKYTLIVLSQCISPEAMDSGREGLENLYTMLSPYAKETVTYGENASDSVNYAISSNINRSLSESISHSFGTSHTNSISNGHNSSRGRSYQFFGANHTRGNGTSFGSSSSNGSSTGTSNSNSTSTSYGSGDNQSTGSTTGSSRSLSVTRDNKAVQGMMSKIEQHIHRIETSQTFGMWNSACYVIADDAETAVMGTSTLASIFSGDSSAAPRAYCNQWDAACPGERNKVLSYLQSLRHPVVDLTMMQEISDSAGNLSVTPYQTEQVTPAMMVSGKELPTLMGLPRKSVPGIVVDSAAEFGRNIPEKWRKSVTRPIQFGNIYHLGQQEPSKVVMDLDAFASHIFICGASGSGKSNTTYQLLQKLIENHVPFLVIEPAKGEYKIEFSGLPGVNVFTADDSAFRTLQLNPFEFLPGIHIREHLDNIVQVVSACWPLYGAMPGILKQGFEQAYINHGWDLEHSERVADLGSKFPTFRDLAEALEDIINNSPYSAQSKGDYKGALLNRVSSLCNGFEGQIFGRSTGIPDRTLFQSNTIIDLSSIGSDETRSLIMGILIIKLRNYRKVMSRLPNSQLIHVTVLEEAHNILKRCSQETGTDTGNVQGAAVASLCRCIAEMRSNGEGFMIIDQSPSNVDDAAIKNTAIKIAMRLPAKDDSEIIGTALSLEESQIRELSRLDVGVAAMFHVGWTDTILAKMGEKWSGRYRAKTAPTLDKGVYTRVQGAVTQRLYHAVLYDDLNNAFEDVCDLVDELCKGPNALTPALPRAKQQEILDEVQIFLTDQDDVIRSGNKRALFHAFTQFTLAFLRLKSLMRVFPLRGVSKTLPAPGKTITDTEKRKVLQWEKSLRKAICRYLFMPEKCDPAKAYNWPRIPEQSEYFWDIYRLILWKHARTFPDSSYENAVAYLESIKHFSPKR